MDEEINVSFEQFIEAVKADDIYQNQIVIMEIDGSKAPMGPPADLLVRLDALSIVFVRKGEIVVTVDYLPHRVTQHMMFELTHKHLLNSIHVSHDAKGYYICLSKELLMEMFPVFLTLPKEYLLRRRFSPMVKLDPRDFTILIDILERLRNNIRRKEHAFHRGIVMNEMGNLVMEITNIGINEFGKVNTDYSTSHNEELAMKFMHLVVTYGNKWNEVSQYSTELCVTPVYLSRAIKAVSGKTVMEWINEARVSEAKILLRRLNVSIQEIAEELNFSDQSAFGKFFKKHMGMSPMEYRRKF